MKKILLSLSIITLVAIVLFQGTKAFFSDFESSSNNTMSAGSLDLKVGNTAYYNQQAVAGSTWLSKDLDNEVFFNLADLKPADEGEDTIGLKVYDNPAWACLQIEISQNDDVSCTSPELRVDSDCQEPDQDLFDGELASQVSFLFWVDDGDNVLETGEPVFAQGSMAAFLTQQTYALADVNGNILDNNSDPLIPDHDYYLGQAWCFGTLTESRVAQGQGVDPTVNSGVVCSAAGTSNASQTDNLKASLSFYLEQARNNANFTCQGLNPSPSANPSPSPTTTTYLMENKRVNSDWSVIDGDNILGNMVYQPEGPTFIYQLEAHGLVSSKNYCLIYYADPWPGDGIGHATGFLIDSGNAAGDGSLVLNGNKDLGTSLPNVADQNYPTGAKMWLIPCSNYSQVNHKVDPWGPNEVDWLFDKTDDGWLTYTRTAPTSQSVSIDQLGGDIASQYGYNFDYSLSSVVFNYTNPQSSRLSGTITASGLKPYTTYQVKFGGLPTCLDSVSGNDTANEYIGYKGRWTCVDCSGDANARNRTDAQYVANKAKADSDPTKECIAGYLVWDFFTADDSGNASQAVITSSSYHVLWCGGGICNTVNNDYLNQPDSGHPSQKFCPADKVDGQIERFSCDGLTLDPGSYHLVISLTEESFHQGNWAVVLEKPIDFTIL